MWVAVMCIVGRGMQKNQWDLGEKKGVHFHFSHFDGLLII